MWILLLAGRPGLAVERRVVTPEAARAASIDSTLRAERARRKAARIVRRGNSSPTIRTARQVARATPSPRLIPASYCAPKWSLTEQRAVSLLFRARQGPERPLAVGEARQGVLVQVDPEARAGRQRDEPVFNGRGGAAMARPASSKLTKYSVIRKFGTPAAAWTVAARPTGVPVGAVLEGQTMVIR
jgi:hypothetical protein